MAYKKLILLVLFSFGSIFSQSYGTTVYSFLNIDYSARSQGLSGNLGLYGGDVDVQLNNPAALLSVDSVQFSASYSNHLLDFSGGYIGYFIGKKDFGTLAIGALFFDYGEFDETNEFGQNTGSTFGASESAIILSYANHLEYGINLGVNLKLINSSLADRQSWGAAFDIAFDYQPGFLNNGNVFIFVKNIGTQFTYYYDDRELLPFSLQVGISHMPQHLPIKIGLLFKDLNYQSDEFIDHFSRFVLSAEFRSSKYLDFRIGYDNQKRVNTAYAGSGSIGGVSLGMGIKFSSFRFDYAISLLNTLGNTHRFGILWNI